MAKMFKKCVRWSRKGKNFIGQQTFQKWAYVKTNLPGLGETRSLKEPYVMRAKKSEKTNAKNVSNIFWAHDTY